jgi:hypothetical protein
MVTSIWKSSLDFYRPKELTALSFACDDDGDKAVELLASDELLGCPYTFTLGGNIIVPTEVITVFYRKKLNFTERSVEHSE